MASYAWKGVCYQDTPSALQAFLLDATTIDSGGVVVVVSASINTSGLVTWTGKGSQISGSSVTSWGTTSFSTQLNACAAPGMGQWPVQSFLFILALFFAAFLGFRTGYRP